MKGIKNEIKRGRPDIVHFSILEATTIPLYLENKLNLFVHTGAPHLASQLKKANFQNHIIDFKV